MASPATTTTCTPPAQARSDCGKGATSASRAGWFYELGLDGHSQSVDPGFVDADGADNVLGFSTEPEPAHAAQIIDDGDSGFSVTGTWTSQTDGGYGGDYQQSPSYTSTTDVATYTFSGLTPGAHYQVAATWPASDGQNNSTPYTILDGGNPGADAYRLATVSVDQQEIPADFTDAGVSWKTLDIVYLTGDTLVVQISHNPYYPPVLADAIRIQQLQGDHGLDDNFQVLSTSPTIDAGDPADLYANEPTPNGSRIDQGHTGNTAEAAASPAQLVQVLSPNGLEKLQAGQQVTINWHSAGINLPGNYGDSVAVDGPTGYWRLDETSGTSAADSSGNGNTGTYLNGVTLGDPGAPVNGTHTSATFDGSTGQISVSDSPSLDPAQLSVEAWVKPDPSSNGYGFVLSKTTNWNDGYGLFQYGAGNITFFVNQYSSTSTIVQGTITTGQWSYVVGTYGGATLRLYINGVLTSSLAYSAPIVNSAQPLLIGVAPGGYYWKGSLDEVAVYDKALSPDQIQAHYNALAYATVDIDLMRAGNPTPVLNIASHVSNNGTFQWKIPAMQALGDDYQIRVSADDGSQQQDTSDEPFLIANNGHDYYVNDSSTAGDVFTTAVGNNLNSGKSPDQPMASVQALLAAYDLDPGDVVHVDTGSYTLSQNIVLGPQDSGVRIEGPSTAVALLNRGNTSSGSYVFQMAGATNVTIDHVTMTGEAYGVMAGTGVGSTYLTVSNSEIYGMSQGGILVNTSNSDALLNANRIHGLPMGIDIHQYNYDAGPARATVSNNVIYATSTGIFASGYGLAGPDHVTVSGNLVHDNSSCGIQAQYNVLVTGNTVYGQSNPGAIGIEADYGVQVQQNVVFDNANGIYLYNGSTASANRVYNNSNVGIYTAWGNAVLGNTIYSNSIGVLDDYHYGSTQVSNNLIYANSNEGIWVRTDVNCNYGTTQVVNNNTVYQPVGDAVRVDSGSQNVQLRNNILWVQAGYDINIAPDSEVGFASDYNDLYTTGTGKIGLWEGRDFTSRADWFYELGLDGHSQSVDPQFVNPAGADGLLGFSTEPVVPAQIVDDGDPGYSLTGTCTHQTGAGLNADYDSFNYYDSGTATWTITGLTPGQFYQVAATWPADGNAYFSSYAIYDGSAYVTTVTVDQRSVPADFSDAGVSWKDLGIYYATGDTLVVCLTHNPYYSTVDADAVRVQRVQGDHGPDDDFHVQSTSPTIDAGDPADPYLSEPTPNGGRVNQGNYGNTVEATTSPAQLVQVLSPNGLEKVETGQQVPIQWRSAGLTLTRPVLLLNAGGGGVDNWSANSYQTAGGTGSFSDPVTTSGVSDPAPAAVYQSYAYGNYGVGQRLSYALPVADGSYTVRLHFVEPSYTYAGGRVFDIQLQGATVQASYDIFAAAGGRDQATTLSFSVTASGGTGILLDLVNVTQDVALLSGIEVTADNPAGVANPTVNLDLSTDNGGSWTTLATGLTMDRFGRGSYMWTAGPETAGNTALIRVTANDGSQPQDTSDEPFLIANNGHDYYVNDSATAGDVFTTAVGNNLNSGKSPDQPMASVQALLAAYDLDPGDVVHVDTGTYILNHNIVLGLQDSGVASKGRAQPWPS